MGKKNSILAYQEYSTKLHELGFDINNICWLVKNSGPLERIGLLISNWDNLEKIDLKYEEILCLFVPCIGSETLADILKYLPLLREKNCPLSFVKSVSFRTKGSILKVIAENYSLFGQQDWKKIEDIVNYTGLNELKEYIELLKKNFSQNTIFLSRRIEENILPAQIHTSGSTFFPAPTPEVKATGNKIQIGNHTQL